ADARAHRDATGEQRTGEASVGTGRHTHDDDHLHHDPHHDDHHDRDPAGHDHDDDHDVDQHTAVDGHDDHDHDDANVDHTDVDLGLVDPDVVHVVHVDAARLLTTTATPSGWGSARGTLPTGPCPV